MQIEELIDLKIKSEAAVTQVYSQVEDLKNQLKQAEIELERSRGEYRAYDRQISMLQSRAVAGNAPAETKVTKEK